MSVLNRDQWDAGRFLETLNYFGEVPFIGSFRWIQQMMGQKTTFLGVDMSVQKRVAVLIPTDSAGNLPESSQVDPLYCFLRELRAACVGGGSTRPDVFTHFVFHPIDSDIGELTTFIASVDATVVLGIPTLSTLFEKCGDRLSKLSDFVWQPVFAFDESTKNLEAWGVLDDVVMGGVSQGGIAANREGQAVFSGYVSTDNSGGFSSVRTKNFEPPFNFSGWEGLRLRVKGDGQRYKFILRNSSGWDSPAYIYGFDTEPDVWQTIAVPFAQMVPTFRAKSMPDAPVLDPAEIHSFQLMLSKFEYDRQLNPKFEAGPFSLMVSGIDVYRARRGVPMIVVDSEERVNGDWRSQLDRSGWDYRYLALKEETAQEAVLEEMAQMLNEQN